MRMDPADIDWLLFTDPFEPLPPYPKKRRENPTIPHAPSRAAPLTTREKKLAVQNILRYVPPEHHAALAKEFAEELQCFGHIYAYRFMPDFELKAPPIRQIRAKCQEGAAIILMILNNLDMEVAQFPQELVTYGGNGQVFSNWIQFRLTVRYLAEMNLHQTMPMYSGHPLGLFPSHPEAPRAVITNGMMIPSYSTKALYDKFFALGVTQYGQMTAGSYCYIGPQGIVHGTTITLLSAVRKYLGQNVQPSGVVFVTSGLGGMSGAQAKAAVIAGCIGVIAEVDQKAVEKRHKQGWLDQYSDSLDRVIEMIRDYKERKEAVSIGYVGNVVDLWERLGKEDGLRIELGSDQTSCHNPFNGGYYPVGYSLEEAKRLMSDDHEKFVDAVKQSLLRQIAAIRKLCDRGLHFWDYGNAFLVECHRAGADILRPDAEDDKSFVFPSYMQDIMGDVFSLGFGPFRWVCTSGLAEDLQKTDQIASKVLLELIKETGAGEATKEQYTNNLKWVEKAEQNCLVVGSQARILYSDHEGRLKLALEFNRAVREGELKAPIIISRDHHDVSGTDSPFRETSNIYDGSAYTADMSVQNFVGDSFRGATWVSLHNGGGVGWGDVINGGFGLLLDGSQESDKRAEQMLTWDVLNGVARRSWSGSALAQETIKRSVDAVKNLKVTIPSAVDDALLDESVVKF